MAAPQPATPTNPPPDAAPSLSSSARASAWWPWLIVIALVIGGAVIRYRPIAERPLWHDEAATWRSVMESDWKTMLAWRHHYTHPPLSYMLVKASIKALGNDGHLAMRLPALIVGVLAIPAAFLLGRRIGGPVFGLIVALLATVDPNMVDQSQQARMYAIFTFIALLVIDRALALFRATHVGPWGWPILGFLVGLSLWSSHLGYALVFGVLFAALLQLVPLFTPTLDWKGRSRALSGVALALFCALLSAYLSVAHVVFRGSNPRGGLSEKLTVVDALGQVWLCVQFLVDPGRGAKPILLLVVVGLILLWRRDRLATVMLACVAFANFLAVLALTRSDHHTLGPNSYYMAMLPAIWCGLAAIPVAMLQASSSLPAWLAKRAGLCRTAGALACVVLAVLVGMQAWRSVRIESWWRNANKHLLGAELLRVKAQMAPEDVVIYCPPWIGGMGNYYKMRTPRSVQEVIYDANDRLRTDATLPPLPLPEMNAPRVWLVGDAMHGASSRQDAAGIAALLARHYGVSAQPGVLEKSWLANQVTVMRFDREGIDVRAVTLFKN